MTRLELAAFIGAEFKRRNINVVLSGGSCVSIYSQEKYVSMDLDFVKAAFTKRPQIVSAMTALGFAEKNRYFAHPDTAYLIEFPPGPLGIGEEPVRQIDENSVFHSTVAPVCPQASARAQRNDIGSPIHGPLDTPLSSPIIAPQSCDE